MTTLPVRGLGRTIFRRRARAGNSERKMPVGRQLLLQALCLFIAFTVIFPILWILSLAGDCRGLARPDGLNLIPPCITFEAYGNVIEQPTSNPVSFLELARNSFFVASSTAVLSVLIGVSAAYAFARLDFRGREILMVAILGVLMLPAVATIAPLFVLLTRVQVGDFTLGRTLLG
ncbi:MAG: ABC transporter permease, partial [Chloroflexi bacterium]|nr:ABC transporter permease [Chloroflexota bacterium]